MFTSCWQDPVVVFWGFYLPFLDGIPDGLIDGEGGFFLGWGSVHWFSFVGIGGHPSLIHCAMSSLTHLADLAILIGGGIMFWLFSLQICLVLMLRHQASSRTSRSMVSGLGGRGVASKVPMKLLQVVD